MKKIILFGLIVAFLVTSVGIAFAQGNAAPIINGVISSGEYPGKYAELNTVKTGVCPNDAYTGTVGRFYFAYDDNGVYIAIESLGAGIWGSSIGFWGDLDNGVGYSESYLDDITNAGGQFAGTSMVHEYYLPYNAADSSGLGNSLEWYAQFVNAADGVSVFNLRESGTCFAALDYYKGTYTLPGPTWTTTSYDQDGWTMVNLDPNDSHTGDFYISLTKADILKDSGVPGKGLENAPGLQKPFNPNSKAAEHAGKKK